MSASKAAEAAARANGGLVETPKIVYEETRPPEIIEPAPLKPWMGKVRHYWAYREVFTSKIAYLPETVFRDTSEWGAEYETEFVEARDWAAKVWVADHEAFDPETNTLTGYGYYRVYLFPIWVQTT